MVALKKVALMHLEEGLSEPTIREIMALQELHSVHVIRKKEVVTLKKVALKRLEEGLSKPTIRKIKVHVFR